MTERIISKVQELCVIQVFTFLIHWTRQQILKSLIAPELHQSNCDDQSSGGEFMASQSEYIAICTLHEFPSWKLPSNLLEHHIVESLGQCDINILHHLTDRQDQNSIILSLPCCHQSSIGSARPTFVLNYCGATAECYQPLWASIHSCDYHTTSHQIGMMQWLGGSEGEMIAA
jgi:hypothetical protein